MGEVVYEIDSAYQETEVKDNESTEVKENGDDVTTSGKEEGLGGTEDDLSNEEDDDDDGVNITIGTIQNPALFNRAHAQFGIPPILGAAGNSITLYIYIF